MQNFIYLPPHSAIIPLANNSHFITDVGITINFSYLHIIQKMNDLPSDHIPLALRFYVGSFKLDIPPVLSVDLDVFVYILQDMESPPTVFHFADDV